MVGSRCDGSPTKRRRVRRNAVTPPLESGSNCSVSTTRLYQCSDHSDSSMHALIQDEFSQVFIQICSVVLWLNCSSLFMQDSIHQITFSRAGDKEKSMQCALRFFQCSRDHRSYTFMYSQPVTLPNEGSFTLPPPSPRPATGRL